MTNTATANSIEPIELPSGSNQVAQPAARKEIKPLTTLRFFAAFAVVVSHASESFACWHGLNTCYIVGQAVTFFFVLSGFILTYNYAELSNLRAALSFYVARIARIWPAHLCSLVLLLVLLPEVFKVKAADMPLFLCNLFLLQSWIPSWHVFFSYNASSWSISTEMFFYLCFPVLLLALNRKWWLPLAISTTVLGLLVGVSNLVHLPEFDSVKLSNQGLLYISPLSSIFNFCVGMTAAYFWKTRISKSSCNPIFATVLEVSAILAVCILNVSSNAMRYSAAPWAGDAGAYWMQNSGPSVLGFAALILIFAMNKGWVSRLFSLPTLVLLGELSFGIYMLHGVLITFLGVNFPQEQSAADCFKFIVTLFVAAHLMFELVEKPMRKLMINGGKSLIRGIPLLNRMPLSTPKVVPINCAASGTNNISLVEAEALVGNTGPALGSGSRTDAHVLVSVDNKKSWRRPLFLVAEFAAFAVFVYFSQPTIHPIAPAVAEMKVKNASVSNVKLGAYLKCHSARAIAAADHVSLSLVWEALQAEPVNFSVRAVALADSNKVLSSTSYTQDGRRQRVAKGVMWEETVSLPRDVKTTVKSIEITVFRNKHELLRTLSPSVNSSASPALNSLPSPSVNSSASPSNPSASLSNSSASSSNSSASSSNPFASPSNSSASPSADYSFMVPIDPSPLLVK